MKYIVYCEKEMCNKEGMLDTIKRVLKNVTYADQNSLILKINQIDNKYVVFIKNRDSSNCLYQFKGMFNV